MNLSWVLLVDKNMIMEAGDIYSKEEFGTHKKYEVELEPKQREYFSRKRNMVKTN